MGDVRLDDLVLSFFFHDRSGELQKSPVGLFRSLLHQVLGRSPDALKGLVRNFEKKVRQIGKADEKWQWHQKELQDFLEASLPKLLQKY